MTQAVQTAQFGNTNPAWRNRLINGAMTIDQRNAGASVGATNSVTYNLDRFFSYAYAASKYTIQQNAGSVTPPAGFKNYLGVTSIAATTVGAGESYIIGQAIEGLNIADLAWGTANASAVTLSFKVYSSLTGTFGGVVKNADSTRSYPFTFTVASANTWTNVSITVPGDTTGTWLTTNGIGMQVIFGLGVGSTFSGTAGSWAAANYNSATGATSVVGTNGATFYITGVQLEVGTAATNFEFRDYGREVALCQRYFEKSYSMDQAVATAGSTAGLFSFTAGVNSSGYLQIPLRFAVAKRGAPTMTAYRLSPATVNTMDYWRSGASGTTTPNFDVIGTSGCRLTANIGGSYVVGGMEGHWTAESEL